MLKWPVASFEVGFYGALEVRGDDEDDDMAMSCLGYIVDFTYALLKGCSMNDAMFEGCQKSRMDVGRMLSEVLFLKINAGIPAGRLAPAQSSARSGTRT